MNNLLVDDQQYEYKFCWYKAIILWLVGMGASCLMLTVPVFQHDYTGSIIMFIMGAVIVTAYVIIMSWLGGFDEKTKEDKNNGI